MILEKLLVYVWQKEMMEDQEVSATLSLQAPIWLKKQ